MFTEAQRLVKIGSWEWIPVEDRRDLVCRNVRDLWHRAGDCQSHHWETVTQAFIPKTAPWSWK